ncbi:hypothetical protein V5799_033542 [Amblyomma americanum]|uniref:Uncharacterized protein n=1 Tax=Amblyomma americanum TaxID=6943 RepID=A0AAQ4DN09_AMBAM
MPRRPTQTLPRATWYGRRNNYESSCGGGETEKGLRPSQWAALVDVVERALTAGCVGEVCENICDENRKTTLCLTLFS